MSPTPLSGIRLGCCCKLYELPVLRNGAREDHFKMKQNVSGFGHSNWVTKN